MVVWQASQTPSLAMCPEFLPVATLPLWQLAHVPETCVWSTCVGGFHAAVVWHFSQVLVLAICVVLLPVAFVPLWQLTQFPVMPA